MAKTLATGLGSLTAFSPAASGSEHIDAFLWNPKDLRVLSDSPGEVVETLVTAPVDQPHTIRTSQRSVPNVYAGTDIDASAYVASRGGTTTYVELREQWKETDDTDPSYLKLLPVRVGISMTIPTYSGIATSDVTSLIIRALCALLYQNADGALQTDRVASLLRGVLKQQNVD